MGLFTNDYFLIMVRGLVLGFIFYTITPDKFDTTPSNLLYFELGFIVFNLIGKLFNLKEDLITQLFLTKMVFSLLDEKARNPDTTKIV